MAAYGLQTLSVDAIVDAMWSDSSFLSLVAKEPSLGGARTKDEVREIVLANEEARHALNRLTHREVAVRMLAAEVDAIEVPLLIEACLYDRFQEIWVVTCGLEVQLLRLIERLGEDQAKKMLRLQLPTRAKLPFADVIVRTVAPPSNVSSFVRKVLQSRDSRL
ncbi:MAG: Dephospho-CoA kinase [Fimbriimonadaceae bacterium]|nr:Dephospho-CoA kinase [Fimbriimonadaceae bacterium]